jgi:hypothetical protein
MKAFVGDVDLDLGPHGGELGREALGDEPAERESAEAKKPFPVHERSPGIKNSSILILIRRRGVEGPRAWGLNPRVDSKADL